MSARPRSTGDRAGIDPKHLYIGIEVAESFFVAITYTTAVVYRVTLGHLNALQLILLGTMLELSYFAAALPTGLLADITSRKLCVIAGRFLAAAGFLLQGLSPGFTVQLIAQVPVGVGAALTFGAQEAWLADEAGETELLGLAATEWAARRTRRLGPASVVSTLLALTVATAGGVVGMAASRTFALAIVAYLAVVTMRPLFSPPVTGWVVGRVDSSVRTTALSATDMFDSGGQIVGGPIVGVIGVLATIRIALVAGAAALAPAAGLLVAATRKVRIHGKAAGPAAPDAPTPGIGQQA